LIIAGVKWGGQLMLTTLVENFPGFTEGIQGPDLMMKMRKQAERHGAEIIEVDLQKADFSKKPFKIETGEKVYEGKSVIIATGADTKWLGVPGEKEKIGRGVSSCAPCDGPFFKDKNIIVVGGGDSAMEEALVLTKFAKLVTIVYRGDTLRASNIMQERAKKNAKIKFVFNTEVKEVLGEMKVSGVRLVNNKTNKTEEMPIEGIFVAIGHMPNSKIFAGIEMDAKGFIKTYDHYKTNVEGVFTAGDVHDAQYKQAITAAGYGCAAALEAQWWLENNV
jgi:thioredoxin reductase (NADPH)